MEKIQEQLDIIIEYLKYSDDNKIAFASVCIAILALIVTIIFNIITHRQYIYSLKPQLSFSLFENNGLLYLSVKNTGKSEAKNIHICIKALENNGDEVLEIDKVFDKEFMLYPEEKIQRMIAVYGKNVGIGDLSPIVSIDVTYDKGNDRKQEKYSRTVSFTSTLENNRNQERFLEIMSDKLDSIMYSENRIANYIEGRTLFVYDRMNVLPHSSLRKDIKSAIGNKGGKKKKS